VIGYLFYYHATKIGNFSYFCGMEKFIIAGGVAIRVSDTVENSGGGTVVLLHGYLENLNVWDELTGLLQPHLRVVAVDLPGHGISEVRGPVHTMEFLAGVVYEVLRRLDVVKCTVIGHSMGGYVALALAETHPEVLDGLVLFSSTPNADSPAKREDRNREIAAVEGGKKELLARTLPSKGFAPQNRMRMADEIEDFAELVSLTEDEGITALLRGMAARPDRGEMLRALKVPQLFILGRHDEYITAEVAAEMIASQPQAHVVWLEGSGHNGFVEQPREAAEAILTFKGINIHKTN
jgi:pimeloyl-ACP methyl ester carboxylesterase